MIDEKKLVMEIASWQMGLCPEYSDKDKAIWEALQEVIEAIDEQPQTGAWIPFTFGEDGVLDCPLPDEDEEILVSDGVAVWMDTFLYDTGEYYLDSNACIDRCAWMPLPEPYKDGVMYCVGQGDLYIKTLEGEHLVNVGDYIIRGVKGEIYPCKPDIFEMTYEPVQLKPCPFCGGEAVIRTIGPLCNWEAIMHTIEPHSHYFADMPDCLGSTFIECLSCNCALSADTEQKAIRAWNRRA